MKNNKAYQITLGGIFLALSVVSVYVSAIVPGVEMSFLAVSSVFVAVIITEIGVKQGIILYVGTVLLSLLIVPNKLTILPYVFFFGIHPVVKFLLEKLPKLWMQMISKIICFAAVFSIAFLFFKEMFFVNIKVPEYKFSIILIGGILIFVVYDYILTGIINIYHKKIKRDIKEIKLS